MDHTPDQTMKLADRGAVEFQSGGSALVAAWPPGSEGAGIADVLFGKRPLTGRLPMTWPRTLDREPINNGDEDYDPLYPYGHGLRTRGHDD